MKKGIPLVLYLLVVAGGMLLLSNYRESSRLATITFSRHVIGDYYLYKKTESLIYVSKESGRNVWGAEKIKPCIYELAIYNDFILAKSHPISYSFPESKAQEGLSSELANQIKVDTTRTVYTICNVKNEYTSTVSEWSLFEKELAKNLIPVSIQFIRIENL